MGVAALIDVTGDKVAQTIRSELKVKVKPEAKVGALRRQEVEGRRRGQAATVENRRVRASGGDGRKLLCASVSTFVGCAMSMPRR